MPTTVIWGFDLDKLARFFLNSPDMKTSIPAVLITFAVLSFALVQNTQAVSPAPDGGYPLGNTAEGENALFNLNGGTFNTALGSEALFSVTNGENQNTAVGAQALRNNVANQNTAVGFRALFYNTTGTGNTATGWGALFQNRTGPSNTANGIQALYRNVFGDSNTAIGYRALFTNYGGSSNTASGWQALASNIYGGQNTATGYNALVNNTNGGFNTATGYAALNDNTSGFENTAVGDHALSSNRSGSGNLVLGAFAGSNVTTANNIICIGDGETGANVSNTTWIANVYNVTTQNGTTAPVIVSADGQLGTVASSERFKKDIATMEKASEAILSLRPVTFHYKTDTKGTPQFGLVAEEVAKVNPTLVLPDKEGKPYTVRYDAVNAMLLNEFLKEHRKVEQLTKDFESKLAEQQKQTEKLTAGLQKVSAELETSRAAPQMVGNDQ